MREIKKIKKILMTIDKLDDSVFGIKYIGISKSGKNSFLHMEYVPNGSLSDIIALNKKMEAPTWFNEEAKLRISKEIAEGMKSLHDHGIVHKDLKPENILLDKNNSIKICDFSFIPEEGAATLMFMAPELIIGEEATVKSDVYSYAVTLAALFGGGEMLDSIKTSIISGYRPSMSVSTPSSIQRIIRKCWQQNPEDRPSFSEIIEDLKNVGTDDDLKIKSMDEFPGFDWNNKKGVLSEDYEYEICDVIDDTDNVEYLVRLHMTIQPDNIIKIHQYCRIDKKIVLILKKCEKSTFDLYLEEKKRVKNPRGDSFVSDFISLFELYHKNGFCFGPFSLKRLFFKGNDRSSLCFDLFMIPGLVRPQSSPNKGTYSREEDVFSFGCFVLKIFNCYSVDKDGKLPLKRLKGAKSPLPYKYRNNVVLGCVEPDPAARPTFEVLFKKLFSTQYKIINNFLSVSVSRFSTFSMRKDFKQEEIEFLEELGSGTFGRVIHAINHVTGQELAVKEFADCEKDKDKKMKEFFIEYFALKTIDHPNIVKIIGASQSKISSKDSHDKSHGPRLFMEFAACGDLRKNIEEPFEYFIVHLFQISSAMKYLHQRGIIHFDLKPENILIRGDGSAIVADFNTAMHVDIDTHFMKQRGTRNYMSPEISRMEKYSFSTDVFSFGLIAAEYFSKDAIQIVKDAYEKHEKPVLSFIGNKKLRSLIEFCVDDDPMSRPSFEIICRYIFNHFIKETPRAAELAKLTKIPRIDDDKLNELRVVASRGSNEAIVEYSKYLLLENSLTDALHVLLKGANEGIASCQNTLGVLSMTDVVKKVIDNPNELIQKASEQGDNYAMTNHAYYLIERKNQANESIEILKKACSNDFTHAKYLLGYIYENNDIEGMKFEERINKAIELYKEAAYEGDAYAQFKYGICLEVGLTTDESGLSCIDFFRQSAYQRCIGGIKKYCLYLEGDRKSFYMRMKKVIRSHDYYRYVWTEDQIFFEEMFSCKIGSLLFDHTSKKRCDFIARHFFNH